MSDEDQDTGLETEDTGDTGGTGDKGFDMEAGVREVAAGLGIEVSEPDDKQGTDEPDEPAEPAEQAKPDGQAGASQAAAPVTPRQPPKAWQREKHEVWSKLDPAAQEYIELRERQMLDGLDQYKAEAHVGRNLREMFTPYQHMIQQAGLKDEMQAVQSLLQAQLRLTTGSEESRRAAYEGLGRNLGLVKAAAGDADGQPVPPVVNQLQERLNLIESRLTDAQRAEQEADRQRTAAEVEAFASDPKHAYFDEVADDIIALIKGGKTLDEAYEKAVWANPVTRQKEIARLQTEADATRREKAKQEAEAARKAAAANMRSRETRKAPTDPKGTWDDTMRDTLREIKERAH